MSQDYQHACERAELLGLAVPTEEEWRESQPEEAPNHVSDDANDEALQELDYSDETTARASGGLDELNSILNATQKKINRFKTVCDSLSTLLKVRVGSRPGTPTHKPGERSREGSRGSEQLSEQEAVTQNENLTMEVSEEAARIERNTEGNTATPRKIDLSEKMGSHLDKLDSLLAKADTAQYSMQHQNKQMRKFLK